MKISEKEQDLINREIELNAKIAKFEEGKTDVIKFLQKTSQRTTDKTVQDRIKELINHLEIGTSLSIL
jgi:hypothetical protein